ncbi:hypothetical protein EVAR_26591_1 [Eumeta japonica]|uniref:Uncharacterized protein n=1 Tax=Eumeta variegata TaxID=151549 RepID=A0A4C1W3N9_EUMVA|nr:hypothetical protein EVAR_26591_1 [Eumeta japonica]
MIIREKKQDYEHLPPPAPAESRAPARARAEPLFAAIQRERLIKDADYSMRSGGISAVSAGASYWKREVPGSI